MKIIGWCILLIFLGVLEKHLWFDQKFMWVLVACSEREFYQHKWWYLAFFQHSSQPLGRDVFRLKCCCSGSWYLHCLLGNQRTVFQSLADLAEENPTFNFQLYPCTRVYCLHFKSGSLCCASWTQFYDPKRNIYIVPFVSAVGSNFWQWWTCKPPRPL